MIPESEFRERVSKVREETKKHDLQILVIYAPDRNTEKVGNTRYLTNWSNAHGASILILPLEKDPIFLVHDSSLPYAKEDSWISDVRGTKGVLGEVKKILRDLKVGDGKVGLVGVHDDMPRNQYDFLMKDLTSFKLENATAILENLRLIKSPNEIKQLKKTAEVGEKAFEAFFESIKPGIPAYKTTAEIAGAAMAEGAEVFHIHFGSGPFVDKMVTPPTFDTLQKGDLITIAFVHSIEGYFNQVCRSCVIGKPSKVQLEVFDASYNSERAVVDAMKPGARLNEVAKAGMEPIIKAGLEKELITRLGHGTGINYGEPPVIPNESIYGGARTEYNQFELKKGMAMILHSGILAKKGGGMYGDTVVVTEKGAEILTNYRAGELIQV